jgi:hypothetical protein
MVMTVDELNSVRITACSFESVSGSMFAVGSSITTMRD